MLEINVPTSYRRSIVASIAGVIAIALILSATPAQAAETIRLKFGAPTRTVVESTLPTTSVGDLTVTTGDVLSASSGKRLGFYATNHVTVRADAATGREIRKVDLSISLPKGNIYATALIRAAKGQPPAERMTFAVVGGDGAYAGARGTLQHDSVEGKPEFNVTINLM